MLTSIKDRIAKKISEVISCKDEILVDLLETPKNLDHGDLALPVFFLAKELKKSPAKIAEELAETINQQSWTELSGAVAIGGFVNFKLSYDLLSSQVLEILKSKDLGSSQMGLGKTMVIDFSSPNVAKKMSIGHLRATVIGQAIYNLAKTQSYKVVGLNHLGDWGTQFGKLAWAIDNWSSVEEIESKPMEKLTELYVRFHDQAEKSPEIESNGAAYFKKLENGDEHVVSLWKKIIELSMSDYNRLWEMLGVKHDLVRGESFYNDRLKSTERLLEDKGLLVESQGAMVVELGDKMPPCLIRKSDGASLYATRDLASAIYRKQELGADLNLYVVGQDQSLHFKQVFAVLDKMGFAWHSDCHHINFGMYRFKDIGKMSTRKGTVVYLEDVLNRAIDTIKKVIEEKNPDLNDKEKVAKQVGIGAIIFNDLVNDRTKNVDFDWERALSFEGDSGPYVQYVGVRCKSILRKYGKVVSDQFLAPLSSPQEWDLMLKLVALDEVLMKSFESFKPHILANYLLDVCRSFNQFYHHCRILGEAESVEASRVVLVQATEKVLTKGLEVLNIECPNEM